MGARRNNGLHIGPYCTDSCSPIFPFLIGREDDILWLYTTVIQRLCWSLEQSYTVSLLGEMSVYKDVYRTSPALVGWARRETAFYHTVLFQQIVSKTTQQFACHSIRYALRQETIYCSRPL